MGIEQTLQKQIEESKLWLEREKEILLTKEILRKDPIDKLGSRKYEKS